MTNKCLSLAIHGGAGALATRDYARELEHMRGLAELGRDRLRAGAAALDVVVEIVAELEASGLYVAGRGASPNTAGRFELDASLMDGPSRRVGAVAALVGFASPIRAARAVMEKTPHVLLAGDGAAAFAAAEGLERIEPDWFTPVGMGGIPRLEAGTVGCVALDGAGALAAATSTGGVRGKLPGRVGDSPIAGAGVWADARVAVSSTGVGEYFVRTAAAAQVAFRIQLASQSVSEATAAVLADIAQLGGNGGLIAVTAEGEIAMPFNTAGMKRAAWSEGRDISAEVFGS